MRCFALTVLFLSAPLGRIYHTVWDDQQVATSFKLARAANYIYIYMAFNSLIQTASLVKSRKDSKDLKVSKRL